MNGVLFRILFGRSHSAHYQSLETRLSTFERHLSKATNGNQESPLHAETILMETFRHASIAAYQAEDEINSTFNIYLILAGIIATGLPVIQGLVLQTKEQHYLYLPAIFSATAAIILVLVWVFSLCFLERFLQLANERFNNIEKINHIQDYYSRQLENQMPGITKILSEQRGSEKGFNVPWVIRITVIIVGSLCLGGTIAIVVNTILLGSILSVAGFSISFAVYSFYYKIRKSKMSK